MRLMRMKALAGIVVVLGCSILVIGQDRVTQVRHTNYRIVKTIPLGGTGLWDRMALDSAERRLYVPRDTHVALLDVDTGATVGDVAGTQEAHGVALAPELGRGFVSNGLRNTVTVFDLKTLKTIAEVKTGRKPDAIVYDSASKTVFAMNSGERSITAIRAADGTVRGTIQLVDDPDDAVSDGQGHLYVNVTDPAEIAVVDTATLSVLRRIPLAPCHEPTGIAMDIKNRRLFSGCGNSLLVITDADSGRFVAKTSTGARTDSVAFDPEPGLVFVANGEGTVTIVHEETAEKFSVVQNLRTRRGARTLALDGKTHRLFLATAVLQSSAQIEGVGLIKPESFKILIVGK